MKDWTGNKKTTFATLGASNHSEHERAEHDYYSTDPNSLIIFLEALKRDGFELNNKIWECACGEGHLSKVLKEKGYEVFTSDLVLRNYPMDAQLDFLLCEEEIKFSGDILTNPPYKYAKDFVQKGLSLVNDRNHVIMFLKVQFLEGKDRNKFYKEFPPKYVYVNSSRQTCYLNGDMSKKLSSATCYCWYIWEKGFQGDPIIKRID